MTARENMERTIDVLADYICAHKDDRDIIAAANAMAKLYSALNTDLGSMANMFTQVLESKAKELSCTDNPSWGIGYAMSD